MSFGRCVAQFQEQEQIESGIDFEPRLERKTAPRKSGPLLFKSEYNNPDVRKPERTKNRPTPTQRKWKIDR